MGERDDRIETLKQRQADIGGGPDPSALGGKLGRADRDFRNARDVMPLGPERDDASNAATNARANLLEQLARVEGELGELERGRDADRKLTPGQSQSLDPSQQPVTSDQIVESPAPTAEEIAKEQAAPDQAATSAEAAPATAETTENQQKRETEVEVEEDESDHQDWEKLETERALHAQHLTEIAGAEADWRYQIAAAEKEMKKLGLDRDGEREFQNNEFTGAADKFNRLFNAQDQQRESLYANNVAENDTVRGVQMIERAGMHESMTTARFALTSEACKLEASQQVEHQDLNKQDAFREKLTRDGMDPSVIEGNVQTYGQRLDMTSMDREQTKAAELHETTFPQLDAQVQQLGPPEPQPQQTGPTL